MKKLYYKELPLFHIYDSNLTGSQKLLMTLLLIDDTYDIYTLGCLAKLRAEDVIFDLQELKSGGIFKIDENRKELFCRTKRFRGTALLENEHRHS